MYKLTSSFRCNRATPSEFQRYFTVFLYDSAAVFGLVMVSNF
jgi:hypothetical protein